MSFQWAMKYKLAAIFCFALILTAGCARNMELAPHYRTVGLRISPASANVPIGSTYKFSAWFVDEVGGTREADKVLWWDLYGCVGTFEAAGIYRPIMTGKGVICASAESFIASAEIEVVAGPAYSIEVYPKDLTLAAGNTIKLYGYINDAYGNRIVDVNSRPECWRFDGTVLILDSTSANMVYAVANAPGNGWVEISWEGVRQRAAITVVDVPRYTFVSQWATEVPGSNAVSPVGVAIAGDGNIWVGLYNYSLKTDSCVLKYNNSGGLLSTLGTQGTGEGEFNRPNDIVFDNSGNMYVADAENGRVQKFNSSGGFIRLWDGGVDKFYYPARIAVGNGCLYVSDYLADEIQKFDLDGNYILKWGGFGMGNGLFRNPSGIAVDSGGNVYIADQANNRIQKFDSNGNFLKSWGSLGYSIGQFINIVGLAVDNSDNLFVTDAGSDYITKFDKDGGFITCWGGTGSANGYMDGPFDVAVDSSGYVYVADYNNKRIQKFGP